MNRTKVSNILRKLKLIYVVDKLRFYIQKYKNRKINKKFRTENPSVKLPPDYLIYESFQMNYHKYYSEGYNSAKDLFSYIEKHIDLKEKKILDWGCGPARIVRHLPEIINNNCSLYGTDYNKKTIEWCKSNISDVKFNNNNLNARLPYSDNYFDVIYGNSVLTHLSEKLHYDWYEELFRVLMPKGVMLLTTQGDNYKTKLSKLELKEYNQGNLIVRGNVKEGHRTYSAFQPKSFMKNLFLNSTILEHIERKPQENWIPQDLWIIRK